jgi:hypothetical protein
MQQTLLDCETRIDAFKDPDTEAIYEFKVRPMTIAAGCHGTSLHRIGPEG